MFALASMNEKGGVGKTTLAVTLAAGLAARGLTVCLVDFDPQGNATLAVGAKKEPGVYDLIVRGAGFQDVVRVIPPEVYGGNGKGQLLLVPSNVETRGIPMVVEDEDVINDIFRSLDGVVDLVVYDTNPSPSPLHTGIYVSSDYFIFPTLCESFSLDGLLNTMKRARTADQKRKIAGLPDLQVIGIVPTMFRENTSEHAENLKQLQERFPDLVWDPIPQRTVWAQATTARQPIFTFAPGSKAAADGWRLVDRAISAMGVVVNDA